MIMNRWSDVRTWKMETVDGAGQWEVQLTEIAWLELQERRIWDKYLEMKVIRK